MKEIPRFFCDNCGCEVEDNAKACPRCGRIFTSVRCPSCGYSGEEKLFANGCPKCGYSASAVSKKPKAKVKTKRKRKKKASSASLPGWVFFFSIFALIFVLVILASMITR